MKISHATLEISTEELSLNEISSILGPPNINSYNKGEIDPIGRVLDRTIWKVDICRQDISTLRECFESTLLTLSRITRCDGFLAIAGDKYINIAIYFDTANCSMRIPSTFMTALSTYGIDLEITCYPADF